MMKRLAATLLLTAMMPAAGFAQDAEVTPDKVVGAFEARFGVTKGQRRNHIKGTCAAGEFIGTADAAKLSRSKLFSGKPVPVVARFSLPGGNPKVPDTVKNVRGLAIEFRLPGDELHHTTMLNVPMFGAANVKSFLALIESGIPDPKTGKPDPERVKAFKANHPDNRAQAEYLAANNPPPSYANAAFYGIHTFRFVDADKKVTLVKFRFVPQAGEKQMSDDELRAAPADFLEPRLIEATKAGPVKWDMMVTIGEAGDAETDPTQSWPAGRREIKAGELVLTSATPQKGAACEPINFDPLVMADGIEPTDDPILQFRSPAYAVSFSRRMNGE